MYNPFKKKKAPKTYADHVAPLRTIIDNLIEYVRNQSQHITEQETKKQEIEDDIKNSQTEIAYSETTISKLSETVVIPE